MSQRTPRNQKRKSQNYGWGRRWESPRKKWYCQSCGIALDVSETPNGQRIRLRNTETIHDPESCRHLSSARAEAEAIMHNADRIRELGYCDCDVCMPRKECT